MLRFSIPLFILLAFLLSCNDKPDPGDPVPSTGKIAFQFVHVFENEAVRFDTMMYVNEAGNQMLFTEIQYFISDVTLHYASGTNYLIDEWKDIHYIDSDIPSTQTWSVYDDIPTGIIDSITFTFGINEEKNQSFLFVNPPESLMFWPDILGGGYHYLKLNGKWIDDLQRVSPFNFHLGIGQIYDNQGNITGFIQNYFKVKVAFPFYSSALISINPGHTTTLALVMEIENWFRNPNTWDFNTWGGDIMQNQAAMHPACQNGMDVFRISLMIED